VTEVERFFRRLVSTLAAGNPARLQGPLLLDDITGSILPYRTHRRALELDTVEDYEAVLLRLCAGEGDLVWTEPEEARKRFVAESRSNNPDLTALYAFENVYLSFRPEPLLWALAPDPRADYRAPEAPPPAEVEPEEPVLVLGAAQLELPPSLGDADEAPVEDVVEEGESPPPTCLYCGGALPTNRTVNFCPHCGQSQTRILCPECRSEVEPGWRHCVNCGAAVGEA
jgi:double zinc ribbon protein